MLPTSKMKAIMPAAVRKDLPPEWAGVRLFVAPSDRPKFFSSTREDNSVFLLDFIARGDFRHFAEHADHRAIAGGGELDGTGYRLGIDVGAPHSVEHVEVGVDPRMLLCPAPLDFDTEAYYLLAFFAQDREDIHGRAAGHSQ